MAKKTRATVVAPVVETAEPVEPQDAPAVEPVAVEPQDAPAAPTEPPTETASPDVAGAAETVSRAKARVSVADHVANVKTKNGAIYHARKRQATAQGLLDAYLTLDTRTVAREMELRADVDAEAADVAKAEAAWEAAKAALAAARERRDALTAALRTADEAERASLQADLDSLMAGTSGKRRNGAVTSTPADLLDRFNRLAIQVAQSAVFTPEVKSTFLAWWDNRFSFATPTPFSPEEEVDIAAHDAVDALPVPESVKATIRQTMKPRPTRAATTQAVPTWGVLPVEPATETDDDASDDASDDAPTSTSAIIARHAVERESLASQVQAAIDAAKAPTNGVAA